jgi:hypothetical protein
VAADGQVKMRRARLIAAYLDEAVRKPYILGYQRCQYIDVYEEHIGVLIAGNDTGKS